MNSRRALRLDERHTFSKEKEKEHTLMRVSAGAAGTLALLMVFLPWFQLQVGTYAVKNNILQVLFSAFSFDGKRVDYPLLSKVLLLLYLLMLTAALILFLAKRHLPAGFFALAATLTLGAAGASLAPMRELLAAAAGVSLQLTEGSYRLGNAFTYAFLACAILTLLAFTLYSAEKFASKLFMIAAGLSIAMVFLISAYLLIMGAPAIIKIGALPFFFGTEWKPTKSSEPAFGILYMILTSVFGTAGAVLIAVPIGVLTAVFLAEIAPTWLRGIVRPAVELLAGIPSVVYGFFALQLIVPLVKKIFHLASGATLVAMIMVLAIMILPTIVTTAETGMRAVPAMYKEASLALGASHVRTIFKVILPSCRSAVLSGVILGVGRAIGETMAIIMVAGGVANFPTLLRSVRPLTVGIVMEMSYASGLHREALFAIGLVLFIFIMAVNILFTKLSKQGVQMGAAE